MHKLALYPLGNADTCLITLDNGLNILFDYADKHDPEDKQDLRIDLPRELRQEVGENYIDVVAFTHADDDHIHRFSDLFYLEHAAKYQDDDRIRIGELWVPAAIILEEGLEDYAKILRAEARHRLRKGKGIRVFSKPEKLEDWLDSEGLPLKDRRHLITSAGQLAPPFKKDTHGVEFFVHSPFTASVDEKEIDRNDAGLVVQATFFLDGQETKVILGADITHEVWSDIVHVTNYYNRKDRLEWDLFKVSHHCSYKALSDEKGEEITDPVAQVKWLFDQGNDKGYLISSSKPIPDNDDDDQPPHRQAANYYTTVASRKGGEFVVTMQHPSQVNPAPIVIDIDESKATLRKRNIGAAAAITSRPAPRAG